MRQPHLPAIAVAVIGLLSGCVVIPLGGHTGVHKAIDEAAIAFIQPGTTTRADILLRLGAPDWAGEKRFVYGTDKRRVGIAFLGPRQDLLEFRRYRALLIEFDESCLVTAWRFGHGSIYFPGIAPAPDPTVMPAWTTEDGMIVGADPYVQPFREKLICAYTYPRPDPIFPSGRLTALGILPIQLYLENSTTRRVTVAMSSVVLELSDGRRLDAASAQAVTDYFPAGYSTGVRELLRMCYQNRELRDPATLDVKQSRYGLVYFILPRDLPARAALATGVTLEVRVILEEGVGSLVTRLALKGQG